MLMGPPWGMSSYLRRADPRNRRFIRHAATFEHWQGLRRCGNVADAFTLRNEVTGTFLPRCRYVADGPATLPALSRMASGSLLRRCGKFPGGLAG